MKITLLRPDKLSMEQIKIFRGIVVSGGQIPLELVDRGIKRADRLALCEIDDEIVGVASIKNPTDAYKIRVFKKAGVEHLANKYDLEIGYAVTKVKYRGRGISPKLIELLIENSKSSSFYATTKVDTMRKILERLRFEKTGADYYNDDKEAVSLYIFNKPTTEKLAESDELFLLRYRYGRAAEMLIAYKTFLHREVIIGENSYCQNNEMVRQVTHTLLLTFYSFIYSLFDKSGTDFIRTTEPYVEILSSDGKRIRAELIEIWEKNEKAISKLRHNIGFHGGVKIKSQQVGYSALSEIHPKVVEFIMGHFSLFFMELDDILPPRENYAYHISPDTKAFFFKRAEKFKNEINDPAFFKFVENMKNLYSDEQLTNDMNVKEENE